MSGVLEPRCGPLPFVQVRLYGKKVLTITHQDYVVNVAQNRKEVQPLLQEASTRAVVDAN
jgi:hypothetical protein